MYLLAVHAAVLYEAAGRAILQLDEPTRTVTASATVGAYASLAVADCSATHARETVHAMQKGGVRLGTRRGPPPPPAPPPLTQDQGHEINPDRERRSEGDASAFLSSQSSKN